jgi:hypothetical protein
MDRASACAAARPRRRRRRRRWRCCEDADSFSYIRLGTAHRFQPPPVELEKGAETGPVSATQHNSTRTWPPPAADFIRRRPRRNWPVSQTDSFVPPRTFSTNLNPTEIKPQRCARCNKTKRQGRTKSSQKQRDPRPDNFT